MVILELSFTPNEAGRWSTISHAEASSHAATIVPRNVKIVKGSPDTPNVKANAIGS